MGESDSDAAKPARIKGLAFRSVIIEFQERYGPRELGGRAKRYHPELEAAFDLDEPGLGVIPNRWYSVDIICALSDAATRDMTPEEFEAFSTASADRIMADTVRGLYRLLFDWIATPARFVKYASRVWASYYDHGLLDMRVLEERRVEARITDWAGYTPLIFALTRKVILRMFENMDCAVEPAEAHVENGPNGLNAFFIAWRGGKSVKVDPMMDKHDAEISSVLPLSTNREP